MWQFTCEEKSALLIYRLENIAKEDVVGAAKAALEIIKGLSPGKQYHFILAWVEMRSTLHSAAIKELRRLSEGGEVAAQ